MNEIVIEYVMKETGEQMPGDMGLLHELWVNGRLLLRGDSVMINNYLSRVIRPDDVYIEQDENGIVEATINGERWLGIWEGYKRFSTLE